jgi:hypothetical protein
LFAQGFAPAHPGQISAFEPRPAGKKTVPFPYTPIVLNANVVKAKTRCLKHEHFCVFFAVSGANPRFKTPVKYKTKLAFTKPAARLPRNTIQYQ